jgi:Zn-dependent protease
MGNDAVSILLRLAIIVLSLAVHEAAHALSARWLGDRTADRLGRVTLNPLAHLDPQGSLIVPGLLLLSQWLAGGQGGFIFGWAKPVPVDPSRFRRPFRDMALVAAAGPASNLLIALAAAQLAEAFSLVGLVWRDAPMQVLLAIILINIFLMLFNLVPIPPLDGSKILWGPLFPLMPQGYRHWYANLAPGQRLLGPLVVVLALGVAAYFLLGFNAWTWFQRTLGSAAMVVFAVIARLTDLAWFWA